MDPWNWPVDYFNCLLSQKGCPLSFSSKDRWIQLGSNKYNHNSKTILIVQGRVSHFTLRTSWAGYSVSWGPSCVV